MCEQQGMNGIWQSDILFGPPAPFSIDLTWTACDLMSGCVEDTVYIVQYRERGSSDMYNTITNVSLAGDGVRIV